MNNLEKPMNQLDNPVLVNSYHKDDYSDEYRKHLSKYLSENNIEHGWELDQQSNHRQLFVEWKQFELAHILAGITEN